MVAKCNCAQLYLSNWKIGQTVELIHVERLGPMRTKSFGNRSSALEVIYDPVAYAIYSFCLAKDKLKNAIWDYMERVERVIGRNTQSISLENGGKRKAGIVSQLNKVHGKIV